MDVRVKKLISSKPLHWTEHAKFKMRQYGLSEARVKRVLRAPVRVEAGIAPRTVAVMQPAQTSALRKFQSGKPANPRHSEESRCGGTTKNLARMHESPMRAGSFASLRMTQNRKWSQEVWVMYADTKKARNIIAAWRYPGVSPVREPPPFPDDLMR